MSNIKDVKERFKHKVGEIHELLSNEDYEVLYVDVQDKDEDSYHGGSQGGSIDVIRDIRFNVKFRVKKTTTSINR